MPETVADILEAHRSGRATPEETVARSYARIKTHADPAVFITLREEAEARAEARTMSGRSDLPLCGIPVAVKDNIDVKGLPTTAACPAFSYQANADAGAVARLRQAGAIVIGKANLDQFATGLVGVRSPYGDAAQSVRPEAHPGRLELGLRRRGRSWARAARARHRYGGFGPRAGGAQQYRRPQAKPRLDLDRGPGAGLPHARLRLGVRAHRRRRVRGAAR